jgi:acetoin utilization deacetylase AcuC-like enzyme
MSQKFFHIAYAPEYILPLPEGHRFPMEKYELIPQQLLREQVITEKNLVPPSLCSDDDILTTHTAAYLEKLKSNQLTPKEQRAIGFVQTPELIKREIMIMQGTINCALAALENGVALNVAGGTHHAFADRGEGFCLLNDIAIAANYLLQHKLAQKILIIDLDVHQGNGTASIFRNSTQVFTFSMHGATNYPFHKEISHCDVGFPNGIEDATYLDLLHNHLNKIVQEFEPDFAFYLSGVDVLATDKFGKLGLTQYGCMQRDVFVFETLHKLNIPCAVAMGGGYSPLVAHIVEAHCNTFKAAQAVWGLG